jgi:hypothetical protein
VSDPAWQHYRVDRESTNLGDPRYDPLNDPRLLRAEPEFEGYGMFHSTHTDFIRLYDRSGRMVSELVVSGYDASERAYGRIADDLLHLDVDEFRTRYGIRPEDAAEAPLPDQGIAVPAAPAPEPPEDAAETKHLDAIGGLPAGSEYHVGDSSEGDGVQILDRRARVVAEVELKDIVARSHLKAQLFTDLAELDVNAFRAKYAITL